MKDTSAYRSDVAAARARVAQLEAMLGHRAPPAERKLPRVTASGLALLALLVVAGGISTSCVAARIPHRKTAYVEAPPPPPPPPEPLPTTGLAWFEEAKVDPNHAGPWAVDAGGKRLLVGLLWDRARYKDGLHVAAFDRATLAPVWTTDALPSLRVAGEYATERYALVVKDGHAIVVDGEGRLFLFDVKSGAPEGVVPTRRGVHNGCIATDGSGALLVGNGAFYPDANTMGALFPWELDALATFAFDPGKRTLRRVPLGRERCTHAPYCSKDEGVPEADFCHELYSRQRANVRPPGLRPGNDWRIGPWMLTEPAGERTDERVTVWDPTNGKVIWQSDALAKAPPRDTQAATWPSSAVTRGGFYRAYRATSSAYVVASLDLATGDLRFATTLPRAGASTHTWRISADDDDVFVPVDDQLVVVDAHTGAVRGRIGAP